MKKLQFDFSANMGGLCRMFAIPVSSFKRIYRDYTHGLNYLLVQNRDDIIDVYFTDESEGFNQEYESGAYKVTVNGSVPKTNPLNESVLKRLDSELWYLLVEDNNGLIRLAGDEDNQLRFKRQDLSGNITSKNQLQFEFSGFQKQSCLYIELSEMDQI